MSLEAKIDVLTQAVEKLTQQLAANQNEGIPAFARNVVKEEPKQSNTVSGAGYSVTEKEEPKKRGRPAATKAPQVVETSVEQPSAPPYKISKELEGAVLSLVAKDTKKVEQIFSSFGVARASHLKPELHEEALNAFTAALEETTAEIKEQLSFV